MSECQREAETDPLRPHGMSFRLGTAINFAFVNPTGLVDSGFEMEIPAQGDRRGDVQGKSATA